MLTPEEKARPATALFSTTTAEQFVHCSSFSHSQLFSKDPIFCLPGTHTVLYNSD